VGGSGGQLAQVLGAALQANPEVRVCVPIVTLETLSEALRCADELGLQDVEVVQVSVARARKLGGHHLMQAQNPVFLVTASGPGGARP
jgi:precorrin-6Y C5,15-methyltransferase (decarboxylating)